jgi:hypothetical protein
MVEVMIKAKFRADAFGPDPDLHLPNKVPDFGSF